MGDRLDIAGEGRWAAEAVADRLRATDPQGADLLAAQIAFLKGGGASARDRAATLAAASGPHQPAYRSQFWLGDLCPDNLTVLEHTWAWL
ncbi:MAG TPA: hypothetical protein VFS00_01540, partial [Polyangiaceae bacterium]|nr:hypothetical protein [Polyangiaceae bacterium]